MTKEDAYEIVSARLDQARGVLNAIRGTLDDKTCETRMPAEYLERALWALDELLDQASEAFEQLDPPRNAIANDRGD